MSRKWVRDSGVRSNPSRLVGQARRRIRGGTGMGGEMREGAWICGGFGFLDWPVYVPLSFVARAAGNRALSTF